MHELKPPSILLVDHDAISSHVTMAVLRRASPGLNISCVPNGQQAIQAITEACPDILVLDLHMPVMNGFDLLQELCSQYPSHKQKMRIYILTASSDKKDMERAKGFQVQGYLLKPLDPHKIALFIKQQNGTEEMA